MLEEVFANRAGAKQVESESNEIWLLDKIEAEPSKGIFTYVKGAMFPLKGYPSSDAIFSINQIKAIVIETIKLISKWYLVPFILLIPKQKAVEAFNRITWKLISPYIIKFHYLSKFAQTLHGIVLIFLMELGIEENQADRMALIFIHTIEYDGAYRYRCIDLFSETSKELILDNPRREISKLARLASERDSDVVSYKFNKVASLLWYLMLVPKIKRAFRKAIEQSEFNDLKYDDGDKYWALIRTDYQFMGLPYKERQDLAKGLGWSYPLPQDKTKL
jgi:hypothetical protein